MLPFLKNQKEGGGSSPVEHVEFGAEEGAPDEEFGLLDAVAEDLLMAIERKDKKMLKAALESLMDHIKADDEVQDLETMGE